MAPLGAQGADLAVQVLGARGHARIANLAHLFRSRLSLQPGAQFIWRFDSGPTTATIAGSTSAHDDTRTALRSTISKSASSRGREHLDAGDVPARQKSGG